MLLDARRGITQDEPATKTYFECRVQGLAFRVQDFKLSYFQAD